jgi:hypothetical protein
MMEIVFIHKDVNLFELNKLNFILYIIGTNNNNNNNGGQQQSNGYYNYRERRNSTGGITGNPQSQPRNPRQQRERANSIRGNSNSTLKFIGDFDFEKSNAEFDKNAIEDEIKKSLSIKTNKEKDDETSNTEKEKENDTEQQPQHEEQQEQQAPQPTSSSLSKLEQQQQQQENNPDGYYDKQKSFFDRISCETTEKEKTYVSFRFFDK